MRALPWRKKSVLAAAAVNRQCERDCAENRRPFGGFGNIGDNVQIAVLKFPVFVFSQKLRARLVVGNKLYVFDFRSVADFRYADYVADDFEVVGVFDFQRVVYEIVKRQRLRSVESVSSDLVNVDFI